MAAQNQAPNASASDRLGLLIKSAYWVALLIVAAMAMASYLLLQQMLAAQQRDAGLLTLISDQRTMSQRVIYLANAASDAPRNAQPGLVASLREATVQFERGYDQLLTRTGVDPEAAGTGKAGSLDAIFFSRPYHLDYFSIGLAANGWRFISALESELRVAGSSGGYLAGRERARLDDTVAKATLEGYLALSKQVRLLSDQRLESMLAMHRTLFFATIGVIVLVALFIFRPMSDAILRKTRDLIEARNSMAFIAVHDGLTGLHNRTFLTDHFDVLIEDARRRKERLAVLQIDLDRFKQINDTLGHAAGDHVLIATAQRMRDTCRASDLCVRLGGDEFVMILGNIGTTEDIDTVVRRILSRINEPIVFQGATIMPGASAGIAVYPVDADNASDLIVHADLALYSAKKQGGGGAFSFFSDTLRQELEGRRRMENDLRQAIAEHSFSVHFQPQVSLGTGAIAGVEALVRWTHPERGPIPPGSFIPIAEKCGLMAAVGRVIVAKAIAEAAQWHRAGLDFGRLAVNVSGAELREPDFDTFLFDTLAREGLPPQKLSLEIVESVILDDVKTGIAAKLRTVRAAGIHLELDDFGTGYASLSHVNPNEIDRLKIDRRFVQNIDANGGNSKIVRAITELARGLGIAIIAEGAETEAELDSLVALGCDQVQGYSIAFPMPGAEARAWLAARMPRRARLSVVAASA